MIRPSKWVIFIIQLLCCVVCEVYVVVFMSWNHRLYVMKPKKRGARWCWTQARLATTYHHTPTPGNVLQNHNHNITTNSKHENLSLHTPLRPYFSHVPLLGENNEPARNYQGLLNIGRTRGTSTIIVMDNPQPANQRQTMWCALVSLAFCMGSEPAVSQI